MGLRVSLAAVAVALASCAAAPPPREEGAPRGDIGIPFEELNEAAKAACQWIWDHAPYAHRYEYCGAIYRDADGIHVGLPMTDQRAAKCGSPDGPPEEPPGTLLLAKYHSHQLTPEPSYGDRRIARKFPLIGHFLCSPSGIVRRYSAKEGTVIVK